MSQGVDCSGHQKNVHWSLMASAGIGFVYAKATEGVGFIDPLCTSHWEGARAAGMTAGLYHYARPDTNSPEQDAAHFAAQLLARDAARPGVLPPCLDMEQAAAVNMISWTQRCITRLRELTGYGPVMIYANTSWWLNQLGGGTWLDDQTFGWTAHYGRAAGNPGYRGARTVMHQWSSDYRVHGYDGPIDINECWVDLATLTKGTEPGPIVDPDPRPDGWWTVEKGQTLYGIGMETGIDWEDLAAWNDLVDPHLIEPGQRLRLTPPDAPTYTVQPGDTLAAIGARLGIAWQAIYALNRVLIVDPGLIQPGWVLALPGTLTPPEDVWYVVRPGDSLSAIAAEQGVDGGFQAIFDANRDIIADPGLLQPGWQIRLPR